MRKVPQQLSNQPFKTQLENLEFITDLLAQTRTKNGRQIFTIYMSTISSKPKPFDKSTIEIVATQRFFYARLKSTSCFIASFNAVGTE